MFKITALTVLFSLSVFAADVAPKPLLVRFTAKQETESRLENLLKKINAATQSQFTASDFKLFEERNLATSHFQFWVQVLVGTPLHQRSIRIWSDLKTRNLIQMEAKLEPQENANQLLADFTAQGFSERHLIQDLTSQKTMRIVRLVLKTHDDRIIQNVTWSNEWYQGTLARLVKVKGRRGHHRIWIDLTSQEVLESSYEEFPQIDIPALVYPIYEEADLAFAPTVFNRVPVLLRNIKDEVPLVTQDPYQPLRNRRYIEDKMDPILGMDPVYQEKGFWSPVDLKNKARAILQSLPKRKNNFDNGLVLDGQYVTVSLHPAITSKFSGIKFKPLVSAQYKPEFKTITVKGKDLTEIIPGGSLLGQLIYEPRAVYDRPARRDPQHDPVTYINDGFDEIQVYYAVDTLMTTLRDLGFLDPELSTRPFNAILYDPDIVMRNNAYYTDDTINFTTYSPTEQNFARDNTTIWHELGHGVMDRLMGDYIELADTGGLSEGMADFIAQIIIQYVTEGKPFDGGDRMRIINQTGFNLTNEAHDDGEAYGGTMNDFLVKAIARYGQSAGVAKVADLTLEAMRLSRNFPGLTATDWFNHMLYADEFSSTIRQPGDLKNLLVEALKGRNYVFEQESPAKYSLINNKDEITEKTPGSRALPILVQVSPENSVTYPMHVRLQSSDNYKFKYPVTVRVQFEGAPIQGAIHWAGQENKFVDYKLNSEKDVLDFNLTALGKCDYANRDDGSCVDYAYVQIWNNGEVKKPVAKKRFYLRIKN